MRKENREVYRLGEFLGFHASPSSGMFCWGEGGGCFPIIMMHILNIAKAMNK